MRPISSIFDSPDSLLINLIFYSQDSCFSTVNQLTSNFFNLIFCKLCACIIFTISVRLPTFFKHISHIVGLRAKKQMSRIATGSIITMMQHTKVVGDRAISQKPSKSVGFVGRSFMLKEAVSLLVSTSCPIPAIIRANFFDLSPKSATKRAIILATINGFKRPLTEFTNSYFLFKHKLVIPETV